MRVYLRYDRERVPRGINGGSRRSRSLPVLARSATNRDASRHAFPTGRCGTSTSALQMLHRIRARALRFSAPAIAVVPMALQYQVLTACRFARLTKRIRINASDEGVDRRLVDFGLWVAVNRLQSQISLLGRIARAQRCQDGFTNLVK